MDNEFLYVMTQFSHVFFENGRYLGGVPFDDPDTNAVVDSCPPVWEYMGERLREGWRLLGVAHERNGATPIGHLYLARQTTT